MICALLLQAEELMRKIEKEEEQISYDDPDKKVFHLCIVNLVIGSVPAAGRTRRVVTSFTILKAFSRCRVSV